MPADFDWQSCCTRILYDLDNLCDEVDRLDKIFVETRFLGTVHNFPNTHFGMLMTCMAKVDFLSQCMIPGPGSQSRRMLAYLNKYVAPGKAIENAIILKMFRHTLMHTGVLRFPIGPAKPPFILGESTGVKLPEEIGITLSLKSILGIKIRFWLFIQLFKVLLAIRKQCVCIG